jgi:hypothetical protein
VSNSDLLEKYVVLYNYGASNGDFSPMLDLFADDAVYEFEDPRIGMFHGRDNIGIMLHLQMPDLNLTIFNVRETGTVATADFGDDLAPMTRLGGIELHSNGGKIKKLIIKK